MSSLLAATLSPGLAATGPRRADRRSERGHPRFRAELARCALQWFPGSHVMHVSQLDYLR